MVLHLWRAAFSRSTNSLLVPIGMTLSILSVACLVAQGEVEQAVGLRSTTALSNLEVPKINNPSNAASSKASLRRLQTWENLRESVEPNALDAHPDLPSGAHKRFDNHYSHEGEGDLSDDWKFQLPHASNPFRDKAIGWWKRLKKFFSKLFKRVFPVTQNRQSGDEAAEEVVKTRERRLGKMKIQQPIMPRDDTPFSRQILPFDENEKNSQYKELSTLFVSWAKNNPKMGLLVKQMEHLKDQKMNPQRLDPKLYNSFTHMLISEMTNAELPIQYREGEYLILDYLLRCDDNEFVREKLYSFYERNEHFRNAVFYGSTFAYLRSLQKMLESLFSVSAVNFHKLVKALKALYEYAKWGNAPKNYGLIEEVDKYAYRVLEDPTLTIREKDPIFEILKRLTGFGGNSDEKFGEAIRGSDYFLSMFVLNAHSKNIKNSEDFHENSWEKNALNDDEVAKRFNTLLHLESLQASVFPKLMCIKITSSRVQLLRDFKKFPILFDSYETLSGIAERFEEQRGAEHRCHLPDAKKLARDCLDIFKNKKIKLEIDEEVWLYGALEHLKTFEGLEVLDLILNELQNEHSKLLEVYNFRFMKRICERNLLADTPASRQIINKANLFKKLRHETKLTDRLSSSYTLVDEIKHLVECLKNDYIPLGSKIQLYEILQQIYGSFPNVRDAKFWSKMAQDPKVVRVSVSLGWLANPENGVLETENNFILQHVNQESGLSFYEFVSSILRSQKPEGKIARAEPITGFGRGIFPNFEIDRSYLKELKANDLLIRIPVDYNGPKEMEQRAILVKQLKKFSEKGQQSPEWMRQLAGLLKQLKLITHWNTRCLHPVNTPALTVSLLTVLKEGRHSVGEQRMLYRVLQHIMDNNLAAQREVLYALKENQQLAYSMDQAYHAIKFERLETDNSLQKIKDINALILQLPPENIWTVESIEDPKYSSLEIVMNHLLGITASKDYEKFDITDKRLIMFLFHYISVRNRFLQARLSEKRFELPHQSHNIIFEKELIIDSVEIPPLIESLQRSLSGKKKGEIWRDFLADDNVTTEVAKLSVAIPKLRNYIGYFIEHQPDLKNVSGDEHTKKLNSVLKRLSSLKLSATWSPAIDVQNPDSLYTIVNDALKGVRAPDRSVRACAAYHRVFQFLEETLPDSEPSKKVLRLFAIDPELQQTERLNDQWKPLYELMERTSNSSPLWYILNDLIISDKSKVFAEPQSRIAKATIDNLIGLCSWYKLTTPKKKALSQMSQDAFMILNVLAIGSVPIRDQLLRKLKDDIDLAKAFMFLISSGFTSYFRAQDLPVGSISEVFLKDPSLYEETTRLLVIDELEKMNGAARDLLMELPAKMTTADYKKAQGLASRVVEYLESAPGSPDVRSKRTCLSVYYSCAIRTYFESQPDGSVSSVAWSSGNTWLRSNNLNLINVVAKYLRENHSDRALQVPWVNFPGTTIKNLVHRWWFRRLQKAETQNESQIGHFVS